MAPVVVFTSGNDMEAEFVASVLNGSGTKAFVVATTFAASIRKSQLLVNLKLTRSPARWKLALISPQSEALRGVETYEDLGELPDSDEPNQALAAIDSTIDALPLSDTGVYV
jgi:hypothetical protein